jgi:hypothetical protein
LSGKINNKLLETLSNKRNERKREEQTERGEGKRYTKRDSPR